MDPDTTFPRISRIAHIALNVRDLDRAVAFYVAALAFRVDARTADTARLALGSERIELVSCPGGAAYPIPRAANDPWFQHFAIAVADMDAAYAQLSRFAPDPITRGGPQLLPPSTGSVTAYKFRDPDGHPLELSHAPGSDWSRVVADGALFLGIDHTALAVQDLDASIAFYTAMGFAVGPRALNQGSEQARLDRLHAPLLDIVTLFTPEVGPHIELLHYRFPPPPSLHIVATGDIVATQTVFAMPGDKDDHSARCLRDPDGHLLCFTT